MQNFWFGAELVFNCELLEGYGKWGVHFVFCGRWFMKSFFGFGFALKNRNLRYMCSCNGVYRFTGGLYPLLTLAFNTFSFRKPRLAWGLEQ